MTDHTHPPALLPCPFCGCGAEIERLGNRRHSTLYQCLECGCSLETGEENGHGLRWNRRTPAEMSMLAVRVKPLVWEHSLENTSFYASWISSHYRIEDRTQHGRGFPVCSLDRSFEVTEPTIEAAKAAAQADYNARIMAAIDPAPDPQTVRTGSLLEDAAIHAMSNPMPAPDPRDAVIAQLVGLIPEVIGALATTGHNISLCRDLTRLFAALAAAKAVMQ